MMCRISRSTAKAYEINSFWYARQDSNLRPLAPEYSWLSVPNGHYRILTLKTPWNQ
jgi:hypothetical protein